MVYYGIRRKYSPNSLGLFLKISYLFRIEADNLQLHYKNFFV